MGFLFLFVFGVTPKASLDLLWLSAFLQGCEHTAPASSGGDSSHVEHTGLD
jgi:hypothetical protein